MSMILTLLLKILHYHSCSVARILIRKLSSLQRRQPHHPYKVYAEKAKARGAYSEFTIDEGWYPPETVERFLEESGGRDSTTSQREYFCKFVTDSTLQILPEWKSNLYVKEVEKDEVNEISADDLSATVLSSDTKKENSSSPYLFPIAALVFIGASSGGVYFLRQKRGISGLGSDFKILDE